MTEISALFKKKKTNKETISLNCHNTFLIVSLPRIHFFFLRRQNKESGYTSNSIIQVE